MRSKHLLFILLVVSRIVFAPVATPALHSEMYDRTYPNGDFYFLIGDLSYQGAFNEFSQFAATSGWLSSLGFRTIMNPHARVSDLQEAIANPNTTAIIWSGHALPSGVIKDKGEALIPTDIFNSAVGPRLKLVVLSNCVGNCTLQTYKFADQIKTKHWEGKTETFDLFAYLTSNDFQADLVQGTTIKSKCQIPLEVVGRSLRNPSGP